MESASRVAIAAPNYFSCCRMGHPARGDEFVLSGIIAVQAGDKKILASFGNHNHVSCKRSVYNRRPTDKRTLSVYKGQGKCKSEFAQVQSAEIVNSASFILRQ